MTPHLWVPLLVTALSVAAGFYGGWAGHERIARADIARLQARHAADKQAAAEEAARRLAAAQEAERDAVHALQATRERLSATNQRLKEALYALPTAGHCGLSSAALGVLDHAVGVDHDLPQGAAEPDRAAAEPAAAAARPAASEAAVGAWIADAARLYDECRARIDAIRQWDEVTHGR